jgi:hypothetical protein
MELYTVLYNGINLYSVKMTDEESAVLESLRRELMDICDALDIPRGRCIDGSRYMGRLKDNCDFVIRYKEHIGYFALCGERGEFTLSDGFPTTDREQAKFIILKQEFWNGGLMYECGSRDELKKQWADKYSTEYDSRKFVFEYTISKPKSVFKKFPDGVISEYTAYMNKWFDTDHWYYNKDTMSFEEKNRV